MKSAYCRFIALLQTVKHTQIVDGKIERERVEKTHSEKINKSTRSLQLHTKAHKTDAESNYRNIFYTDPCAPAINGVSPRMDLERVMCIVFTIHFIGNYIEIFDCKEFCYMSSIFFFPVHQWPHRTTCTGTHCTRNEERFFRSFVRSAVCSKSMENPLFQLDFVCRFHTAYR